MNEGFMLMMRSQRSRSGPEPPKPLPPLVTLSRRALLTLVRRTLSPSGGQRLVPGWKVTAVFLPRQEPATLEFRDPDLRPPPSPNPESTSAVLISSRGLLGVYQFRTAATAGEPGPAVPLRKNPAKITEQHFVHSCKRWKCSVFFTSVRARHFSETILFPSPL